MSACVFCSSPATTKKGEHILDDWLNRLDGKVIKDRYTFTRIAPSGSVIRQFQKAVMDATSPVVCDDCNEGWMSDLTNHTKSTAEGFIRYERSATLIPLGLATLASFAFMKAVVLDAANKGGFISRRVALAFARSLIPPAGVQIWLACFRSGLRMSVRAHPTILRLRSGPLRGYDIYVLTYALGNLVIQLTYPKWTKASRKRPPLPFITQARIWDVASVPIWPDVATAEWPPEQYLDSNGMKLLQHRFSKNMQMISALPNR